MLKGYKLNELEYDTDTEFYMPGNTMYPISYASIRDIDGSWLYLLHPYWQDVKALAYENKDKFMIESIFPDEILFGVSPPTITKNEDEYRSRIEEFLGMAPTHWIFVGNYDVVCLNQSFGGMMSAPRHWKRVPKELSNVINMSGIDKKKDYPRYPGDIYGPQHNALCDSRWGRHVRRDLQARCERNEFGTISQSILDYIHHRIPTPES